MLCHGWDLCGVGSRSNLLSGIIIRRGQLPMECCQRGDEGVSVLAFAVQRAGQ